MKQADINSDQLEKRPLVTVIIPVFNRANSIAVALRSVADQTFADWEVIVVDDGSTDGSADVALRVGEQGKVRVIRHDRNLGCSAARNSGIVAARGRYVCFLDSDDSWHPEKLSRQVETVEANPDPNMVFCATQTIIFQEGKPGRTYPERAPFPGEPWSEFLYVNGGFAQTSSFFLSRELAMKVRFRPSLLQYEDHMFFLDAEAHGARYELVDEPLSNWNDDPRADRIGVEDDFDRSCQFLQEAQGLLTDKARMAFEAIGMGPHIFKESPIGAIKLFKRTWGSGAISSRSLLAVCIRCVLPASATALLRQVFRIR